MASDENSFITLVAWLNRALGEGSVFVAELDTDAYGVRLPEAIIDHPSVQAARQAVAAAGQTLSDGAGALEAAASSGDDAQLVRALIEVADGMYRFYVVLDNLVGAITSQINPTTLPDAAERSAAQAFAASLARGIADYLILTAIEGRPRLALLLKLLGLIEWTRVPADPANPLSQPHVRKRVRIHAIKDLVSNPSQHLIDSIGWGSPGFDPTDFFLIVESFYDREAAIKVGRIDDDPYIERGIFRLRRDSTQNPPGLKLEIRTTVDRQAKSRVDLSEQWGLGVDSDLTFTGGVSASLRPPLSASVAADSGEVSGKFRLYANRNEAARPFDIVGGNPLVTLSAQDVSIGVGLDVVLDAVGGETSVQPLLFSDITGATLRLGTDDADSFIASLLSNADVEGAFDVGIEWQGSTGLRVKASGGIEIALPIHRRLGPIEIQTVYLMLRILSDGSLSLEVSAALSGSVGPLTANVDRIGSVLDARFAEGSNARFGPLDLDLRFKPPNGIGLAIDGGVVKGGGYVYLDVEKGEYAGALELTVADFLSLKAIGLINTRLPGGQSGFSLLVIITADFSPGFQLGFGFTLLGVGGLLGLNRVVLLDPLTQGVRTGAVNRILFPTDVIANAPKILSDLRAIFPPQEGTFLIGPMAKLGWGTPPLISISLGVIIEIPGDVVIVGRLRVALPTDEAPVLVLQVTFVGALEFAKRRIWFFATLFESRVLFITLEGEMGLLMDFSDNPNFVLSVGGFHPRFTAPPLPFPTPARITLSLINESWARLRADAYFAVTSNSVQMGCRAEAFFGFDALSVEGHLSFDALLRFSPFYLIVEISTGFKVKVFGVGVWGVHLRGTLEGPTPWRVRGSAEISLLFWSIDVDVDVTFGERRTDTLPPIEVLPRIRLEFEKLESWRATLPPSGQFFVSLRDIGSADALVLHPVGTLQISQRFAPLNLPLDKIGNQKPSDVTRVTATVQAGALSVKGPTRERFAPAQYRDMDDAAKLSAPAYEPLEGGIELEASAQPWATGPLAQRTVRYETIIMDTALEPARSRFFEFWGGLFAHFRAGAAVARATPSLATQRRMQPFASTIAVAEEQFTVAFQADSRAYAATATFWSFAEAQAHFEQAVRLDPNLADSLHVIPSAEVHMAA